MPRPCYVSSVELSMLYRPPQPGSVCSNDCRNEAVGGQLPSVFQGRSTKPRAKSRLEASPRKFLREKEKIICVHLQLFYHSLIHSLSPCSMEAVIPLLVSPQLCKHWNQHSHLWSLIFCRCWTNSSFALRGKLFNTSSWPHCGWQTGTTPDSIKIIFTVAHIKLQSRLKTDFYLEAFSYYAAYSYVV